MRILILIRCLGIGGAEAQGSLLAPPLRGAGHDVSGGGLYPSAPFDDALSARRGFVRSRLVVVRNGVDTDRFRPDDEAGRRVRLEWAIRPDERLIGLVGRFDPMKGHADLITAAALLRERRRGLRYVFVGEGP